MLQALDRKWKQGALVEVETERLAAGPVRIVIHPSRPFSVRVVDPGGRPLGGSRVRMGDTLEGTSRPYPTDAHGVAHPYPVLEGGRYYVLAEREDYYHSSRIEGFPVAGSEEWKDTVDVVMIEAKRTQRGRVLDPDGNPALGATVFLDYARPVFTDKNGEFALPNLPDLQVGIRAITPNAEGSVAVDKDTPEALIQLRRRDRH